MAFFSKSSSKKSDAGHSEPRGRGAPAIAPGRAVSARELAAHAVKIGERRQFEPAGNDITITGSSLGSRAHATSAFEVAQANPGLCAVLENAALRFASGQAAEARSLLEQGIAEDPEAKLSPLAWLALFDLLQRDGDRPNFDRLAMQYVLQFERSAPAWEAPTKLKVAPKPVGGYVAVSGRITSASAAQIDGIRRAIARHAHGTRVDLMSVYGFDDAGARLLASALADARRTRLELQLQLGNKLMPALEAALAKGREAGDGAWLLALELLQWSGNRAAFEDQAIEFAVTFEVSPPSWEPAVVASLPAVPETAAEPAGDEAGDGETLRWSGVLTGSLAPQLGRLADFAHARTVVAVDVAEVERIDFAAAGAMLNLITRLEAQRKAVQVVGASPMIRALLLLIGVSPRHFVKKPQ